jgi:hypothetical protein
MSGMSIDNISAHELVTLLTIVAPLVTTCCLVYKFQDTFQFLQNGLHIF